MKKKVVFKIGWVIILFSLAQHSGRYKYFRSMCSVPLKPEMNYHRIIITCGILVTAVMNWINKDLVSVFLVAF